jgi:hypothetical protein
MANIGTACVRVADYARPAGGIGTPAPLAGITPGLPRGRTAHGNCPDLPRTGTVRNLARGIGAENLPFGQCVTIAAPRANFHEISESMGA